MLPAVSINFYTHLDEAESWLQYLQPWPANWIPQIGSEIQIKHPSYKVTLTLKVVAVRYELSISNEGNRLAANIELNIPNFIHSIAEWEEWYQKHFK